jgi:predicted CXXCH cytochrome family protein
MSWRAAFLFAALSNAAFAAPKPAEYVGSKVCITCHAREYDSWRKTPMANASGPAAEAFIPGSFSQASTGTHFEIKKAATGPVIDYRKTDEIKGSIALEYFVGSGKRGRTYLFQREGWWFEAPINWYSKKRVWDLPPGLQAAKEIPLTLPVDAGCLQCHATNVTRAANESRNKFGLVPLAEGGVGCEACHGPAGEHVRAGGKSPMLRLAKLEPSLRDSICMQCHLEAEIQVDREGRRKTDYRPGNDLLQATDFFFRPPKEKLRAVSQFESLWESKCKAKSGAKMTCTTCHAPHTSVAESDRVNYYRDRCVTCHGETFARKHQNGNPKCVGCHMPTREADVAHEEATDHRILRTPNAFEVPTSEELIHFPPGTRAGNREIGLAYTQAAARTRDSKDLERSQAELDRAVHSGVSDANTWAAIGFVASMEGQREKALAAYESALQRGSTDPAVLNDAAVLYANRGNIRSALTLWKRGFEANPWQSELGMNLAQLYCAVGDGKSAENAVKRVLEFNPDSQGARTLLARLPACGARNTP